MTRDEWLQQFEDELKKLRPHVGQRLATTMAPGTTQSSTHATWCVSYDKSMRAPAPAKMRPK